MRASVGPALLLALAALHWPAPASADCYFVYDEGFRASYKRASGMTLPRKAGHLSSMAECQATLHGMLSDPQYSGDVGLGRTRCECYGDEGGAQGAPGFQAPQGGTLEQQLVSGLVSSLLGALLQGLDAPPGQDGEAIRKKLQKQWDDEEAERRVFEKKREEEIFRKAHQAAAQLLGSRPAGAGAAPAAPAPADGVYLGTGTVPRLLRDSGAVTEAEWAEARGWQARIDALRAKGALTAAEERELAALEARRNARWSRAVSTPGLTQRERDALRLKLHVASGGGAAASVDDLLEVREQASKDPVKTPVHPLTTLVEGSVTTGLKRYFETAGEETAALAGKGAKVVKFGEAYALGGVAVAFAKGKPEEAAEPIFSWSLAKVVARAPGLGLGVGLAQGGGAITAGVARRSIERLVEATDQVVPGILAPGETGEDWWKRTRSEMTLGQKFVTEGIGM